MQVASVFLILFGAFFFLAGTIGLLRFPDTLSRLHALTKADNLGLGFVIAGLAIQGGSITNAIKLAFIWLIVIVTSSSACYLLGQLTVREQNAGINNNHTKT